MFKRAIAIFAFSVFLISYTTPVTTQPLPTYPPLDPLPALVITDLFLSSQRKLIVTITNLKRSRKRVYGVFWLPTSLIGGWKDTS